MHLGNRCRDELSPRRWDRDPSSSSAPPATAARTSRLWPFAPLSYEPPLVALGLKPTSFTCEILEQTGTCTLSTVDADAARAVLWCGSHSGRTTDKSEGLHLRLGRSRRYGAPLPGLRAIHLHGEGVLSRRCRRPPSLRPGNRSCRHTSSQHRKGPPRHRADPPVPGAHHLRHRREHKLSQAACYHPIRLRRRESCRAEAS